jgi:hypothetical protein
MKLTFNVFLLGIATLTSIAAEARYVDSAPVSGFARSFLTGEVITDASVTVLESGLTLKTDKNGRFGPFYHPIGDRLTLQISKSGYATTQSATVVVPKEGLVGPYDNITFQVPSTYVFYVLSKTVGAKLDDESCHVTATVTAYHKTLDDLPQGEKGAVVMLEPSIKERPFYFDIFTSGPLKGKTYPFPTGLTVTSDDGGIAFFNVPPRNKPYRIVAMKAGVQFSDAEFMCEKGKFVNLSPPRGPSVLLG